MKKHIAPKTMTRATLVASLCSVILPWIVAACSSSLEPGTPQPPAQRGSSKRVPGLIAFQSSAGIEVIAADGSGRRVLIADTTAFEPAWSPDGAKLAFTRTSDGWKNCGIYTARADGSQVQRVTAPYNEISWCARSPAWSPDGTKIAYSANLGGGCPNSECSGQNIYVVRADGSGQEQVFTPASLPPITKYPMAYYTLGRPTWSPDGRLAFECNAAAYGAPSPDFFVGVCAGTADGSSAWRLIECCPQAPAWSPDGLAIAFQEYGPGGIGLMNPDGTNIRDLLLDVGLVLFSVPAWSPDGSQLVYIGGEGEFVQPTFPADYPRGDLYVMNRDGTNSRRLTTTGGLNYPSWAPSPAPPSGATP